MSSTKSLFCQIIHNIDVSDSVCNIPPFPQRKGTIILSKTSLAAQEKTEKSAQQKTCPQWLRNDAINTARYK